MDTIGKNSEMKNVYQGTAMPSLTGVRKDFSEKMALIERDIHDARSSHTKIWRDECYRVLLTRRKSKCKVHGVETSQDCERSERGQNSWDTAKESGRGKDMGCRGRQKPGQAGL